MKIKLTNEEVALIVTRFLTESQRIYENGSFDLQWEIAAATGQPALFVGATITVGRAK